MNDRRHKVLVTTFATAMAVLIGWQSYHVFIDRYFLQDKGRLRVERVQEVQVQRGVIYDRLGEPLAISTPVSAITVNPSTIDWDQEQYDKIARILGQNSTRLKLKVESNRDKSFIYLARRQPATKREALQALQIPGLDLRTEYRRYYPMGEVASHITGIADIDEQGIEGLEKAFNNHLKGETGIRGVVRDNDGRLIQDLRYKRLPKFGEDLYITVDGRLQFLAHHALEQVVEEYQAKSASLVLVHVPTGGILALANIPTYNPNNPSVRPWSNMRNRAVTDLIEPGSTFKPFLVMEALASGRFTPESEINTSPGWTMVRYKTIEDPRDYGVLSLTNLLVKSSQVGATKLALQMPDTTLVDAHRRAGFQDHVLAGLPGEALGQLSGDDTSEAITRATMSFGYGFSVTPLQLARAYLTLATGGLRRQVTILMSDDRGVPDQRVYEQGNARAMLNMLTGVVGPTGTARLGSVEGFSVAGKTGTIRNTNPEGGYATDDHSTLFVGMIPAQVPEYVGVVVVVSPKPKGPGLKVSGGSVSAPVFKQIATSALQLRSPTNERSMIALTAGEHAP